MSQEDIRADIARKALELCRDRMKHNPNIAVPGMLESILAQLEWLVAFFEGRNSERNRLHTLVFGHYAAREIDERDEEFVQALHNASYVASRTASGLKIDLKVLGYDS
jgi:hypothetical protein